MLKSYSTSDGYINRESDGEIARLSAQRVNGTSLNAFAHSVGTCHDKARTYRTRAVAKPQTAIGRIRAAVSRMYPQYDHATIGAIAKQILKSARHVRLDVDNPNTHLAFSPGTVKARDTKGRRSLSFAKFLRRKCSALFTGALKLSDSQVENAHTAFQLIPAFPLMLSLVTGQDAFAIYADRENGISSCMSGNDTKSAIVRHHFLANPETLQLVVARAGKQLAIRAKLFANDDGETHFLDRIYDYDRDSLSGVQENELREWIHNWLSSQNIVIADRCKCTLNHEQGEPMPYLDRARQFDRDGDEITLWARGEFCADNTDGTDPSLVDNWDRCSSCGCCVDEDDCRSNDIGECYCESCYNDAYSWDDVNECEIPADDCVEAIRIRHGREETVYTYNGHCVELHDGRYALTDDAIELHNGDYALADDCVELHDGQYALTDDTVYLYSDEYALTDDAVQLHDGQYALNDDADIVETTDGEYAMADDCDSITDDYGTEVFVLTLVCA